MSRPRLVPYHPFAHRFRLLHLTNPDEAASLADVNDPLRPVSVLRSLNRRPKRKALVLSLHRLGHRHRPLALVLRRRPLHLRRPNRVHSSSRRQRGLDLLLRP